MNTEQIELMTRMIREEHPREDIRSGLISQGFPTEGFEENYKRILSDLHLTEPHVEPKIIPSFLQEQKKTVDTYFHNRIRTISRRLLHIAIFSGIFVLLVWGALRFAPQLASMVLNELSSMKVNNNQDLSISDAVLRSKVETTAASMRLYGQRMGSFDGACKDVIIIAPISCVQNSSSYAIYAPLLDGQQYCIDSTGFKGDVQQISFDSKSCELH